jgi:outer membrane protein assembly factor BamB
MFHVKRRLGLFAGLVLLGLLAAACGGAVGSRGWAAPARIGDLLLVSTSRNQIDGFNAQTRQQVWRFPDFWDIQEGSDDLEGVYGTPVVSRDGRTVFFGDYNGYVYAFRPSEANLDASRDEEKPKAAAVKLNGPVIGGVTLDQASGLLFVAAGDNLYTLQSAQLESRIADADAQVSVSQLFQTDGEIWSQPLLADGKVFISSLDGNMYAIDQRTGQEVWRFTGERSLASTPAMAAGTLLVGGFDRRLHAVDIATGTNKWSFEATDWVWSRPALDGSLAYFGDFDGNVYGVNVGSGALAWSVKLDKGAIRGAPVLSRGVLVVGTVDGWLVGIDPVSRALNWQKKLETAVNADLVAADDGSVLIAPSGCVALADSSERVYFTGLDPTTGELRPAQGPVC